MTQVRQEATTESNVVTYEVVISAPNDDMKLKPGLTANVTIFTSEATDVLCVPTKALKYQPAPDMVPKGTEIVDCDAGQKVWTLDGKTLKAVGVATGASSSGFTQINSGIEPGTRVVTGVSVDGATDEAAAEDSKNPFMPGPPNRGKNQKK